MKPICVGQSNVDKEDVLKHIDQIIAPRKLDAIDKLILEGSWDGKEYDEITKSTTYSVAHVKHLGKGLWDLLSKQLGQPVTKRTFRPIFEQMLEPIPVLGDQIPTIAHFYGRVKERSHLLTLLDQNHLVALIGPPGIGKTALAAKSVQASSATTRWERVVWKTLHPATRLEQLIESLLSHLQPPSSSKQRDPMSLLIDRLAAERCLIVLDSAEVVREHPDYETFLRQIVGASHRSCMLLTSEDPIEVFEHWEFSGLAAKTLFLKNLDIASAKQILRDCGLRDEPHWQNLIDRHGGNPLVLKLVGNGIADLFNGNVEDVIENVSTFFNDELEFLIGRQFRKLNLGEKRVILALAQADTALTFADLLKNLTGVSSSDLVQVLNFLAKRSMIEIVKQNNQSTAYKLNLIVRKHALNTLSDEVAHSVSFPVGA